MKFENCYLLTYSCGAVQKIIGTIDNNFIIKKCDDISQFLNDCNVIKSSDEYCIQDITDAKNDIYNERRCEYLCQKSKYLLGAQFFVEYYTYFSLVYTNSKMLFMSKDFKLTLKNVLTNFFDCIVDNTFNVGRFKVRCDSCVNDVLGFSTSGVYFKLSKNNLKEQLTEEYIERLDRKLYPTRTIKRFKLSVTEFLSNGDVCVKIEGKTDYNLKADYYKYMSYDKFKKVSSIALRYSSEELVRVPKIPEYTQTAILKDIGYAMKDAGICNEDIYSTLQDLNNWKH